MIRYTTGNLLDAPVEALVNTVNTVGVMGKGIALMFKERFPANMRAYAEACKQGDVVTGKMFITQTGEARAALDRQLSDQTALAQSGTDGVDPGRFAGSAGLVTGAAGLFDCHSAAGGWQRWSALARGQTGN